MNDPERPEPWTPGRIETLYRLRCSCGERQGKTYPEPVSPVGDGLDAGWTFTPSGGWLCPLCSEDTPTREGHEEDERR